MSSAPKTLPSLLSPRHWLSWLGLGIVWLVGQLPYRALMALGRALGALTRHLPGERRHVAQRNLELCMPHLSADEKAALLRATLRDLGCMFVEFALAWFGSDRALAAVPCERA